MKTRKAKQKFKIADGSRLPEKRAQVYGEFLYKLAQGKSGKLTAWDVLTVARSEDSPIHECFLWDDSEAAHRYRIEQARHLLRSIEIVVVSDDEERCVHAFFNCELTKGSGKDQNVYITAEVVARNESFRLQIVENALREIKSWQARYRDYSELARIFGAIEETQQRLFRRDERKSAKNLDREEAAIQ